MKRGGSSGLLMHFMTGAGFLSASSPVEMAQLYTGDVWAAEFPRTLSRLGEMTRITQQAAD